MDTHDPDEYLPVEAAGNVAGISPRTLRYWVRGGKLPAIEGQRGKLVRLGDVLALADLTGKMATLPATSRQAGGNAGNPATSAVGNTGKVANPADSEMEPDEQAPPPGAVSPAARSQLEAIRDEWLRPLVDRIGELEREAGRLQAEREAARRERDDLAARVADDRKLADQLVDVLQHERDAAVKDRDRVAARLAEGERWVEILTARVRELEAAASELPAETESRCLSGPAAPISPPAWRVWPPPSEKSPRRPRWRFWERWR